MKKNSKGFTLVELIAVIVVLAIIAIITVPIIQDSVKEAKEGSIEDSAYGYINSVENYYYTEWANNQSFELNGVYVVSNGNLNDKKIKYKGKTPSNGYLYYDANELVFGCLTIGGYKVELNDKAIANATKGECTGSMNVINNGCVVKND